MGIRTSSRGTAVGGSRGKERPDWGAGGGRVGAWVGIKPFCCWMLAGEDRTILHAYWDSRNGWAGIGAHIALGTVPLLRSARSDIWDLAGRGEALPCRIPHVLRVQCTDVPFGASSLFVGPEVC